ncbi:MAG: integration host factor subunit beta [Sphingobacteriaceae bacterium]|nr:integration host factor subunit beta [Sphingobacteriaceae bacterium]
MTKAEIVSEVSAKTGIQRGEVSKAIEAFVNSVKSSMIKGENIHIRGFGSFLVKKRATKIARNISANTALVVPEHFVPVFKPADMFVERVKESN